MTIGASIFVGVIGAILRYAVADQVKDVDLRMIGLILIIAAIIGLVLGLIQLAFRRRTVLTEVREVPPSQVPPPRRY